MSAYLSLEDKDYVAEGVVLTHALILQASSVIDGYCGRSLGVEQKIERITLTEQKRGHLTYTPIVRVVELKGRPAQGLLGDIFGTPRMETVNDIDALDLNKSRGDFVFCGSSPFGMPYSEIEVTYETGWETTPEIIKVATGIVINQIAMNPNPNVQSKKDFDFSISFFGSSMITEDIASMLAPYVLRIFR